MIALLFSFAIFLRANFREVSVFDGIGGARRASELQRLNVGVFIAIENDPFCSSIVKRAWPDVKQHKDADTRPILEVLSRYVSNEAQVKSRHGEVIFKNQLDS